MKKITIAFDVDGTLRDNKFDSTSEITPFPTDKPIANEEIRTLLIILSKFKNIRILVWSGGGELYARQICGQFGLTKYVDAYAGKIITEEDRMGVRQSHPNLAVDIAIDDIQDCVLGGLNLICKQK